MNELQAFDKYTQHVFSTVQPYEMEKMWCLEGSNIALMAGKTSNHCTGSLTWTYQNFIFDFSSGGLCPMLYLFQESRPHSFRSHELGIIAARAARSSAQNTEKIYHPADSLGYFTTEELHSTLALEPPCPKSHPGHQYFSLVRGYQI